jgi:cobalamin biosynthesis Mg chelatase CobN
MAEQRRLTWVLLAALLTFAALALSPARAHAQSEDGVTVDPNSPSGKEYDIPTERARRDAGGSNKKKSDKKDKKAPLFGEGVGKEPTATPTATSTPTATATPTSTASSDAEQKAKAERRKEAKAREAAAREKAREADEQKQQDAVAAVSTTPTPSPSPPPTTTNVKRVSDTDTGGASSWALIGGILLLLAVAGTGGGLFLRRRFS